MIDQALVLCAGLGTRMRHLSIDTPKPLIKLKDKTFLEMIVSKLSKAGIRYICINGHYLHEQVEKFISDILIPSFPHIKFRFIYESKLLEVGGTIKNALPYFDNKPFFSVNADAIIENDISSSLQQMSDLWLEQNDLHAVVLVCHKNKSFGFSNPNRADWNLDSQNRIIIEENPDDRQYNYVGIQIISSNLIAQIAEQKFHPKIVWYQSRNHDNILIKIKAVISQGRYFHVGDPETLQLVEDIYDGR